MKLVKARLKNGLNYKNELKEIDSFLDTVEKHSLEFAPWPAFSYKPDVLFSISYTEDCIMLKFYVKERFIRAVNGNSNDPVYQDSCVEFFISFNDGKEYYNVEFNCIGTGRIGFGSGRGNRILLPEKMVRQVKTISNIQKNDEDVIHWEMTLVIPVAIFCYHEIPSLHGLISRVNFYKCGDNLPDPHFLSWTDIQSPEPDFHQPDYYGTLVFN